MIDKYGVSESSAVARQAGGVWVGDSKVDAEEYYSKVTTAVGTYYTYSATNIRLSELSLSYQLPKTWFKNHVNMTLGLTGKNLWMIYCKALMIRKVHLLSLVISIRGLTIFNNLV